MRIKATAAPEIAAQRTRAKLQIDALCGFRAGVNGQAIYIKSKKAQAIIVYLLLGQTRFETRGRLCGLLWGESPEENARASLRQQLHSLREAFQQHGFDGFSFDRDRIGIASDAAVLDVSSILRRAEEGEIAPILLTTRRIHDELLRGFDDLDPAFADWLQIERQLFADRLGRELSRLLGQPQPDEKRITVATALLNLDPTHEEACRILMSALAQRGEVAAGLTAYQQLRDVLAEEYSIEPSRQTRELAAKLKSEPAPQRAQSAGASAAVPALRPDSDPLPVAAARSERRPIVIASFAARGISAEFSYLVSGFRSDLITKLVRFREWMIINGANVDRSPAGRFARRWAEYLLIDASVFQVGKELKITLNIAEQPDGVFVWGETYRLDLENWFEIERTLVARIATVMNLHLSTARLLSSSGYSDVSLDIYDRWLRGQAIIMGWRPERERGRELYKSILAEAPGFSPAYSSLAQIENVEHIALPGLIRTSERERLALEHAKQAVRLDPFDSRAHLSLGWSSIMNGHFDQGIHRFQTAVELNGSDPWTVNSAALGLAYCGLPALAVELIEHAVELGLELSNYHWAYQGVIRFLQGDYHRAVEAFDKAENVITDMAAWKAAALSHLGRSDEARAEAQHFVTAIRGRWHGEAEPAEEEISAWLLHAFPIQSRADWERLRDGIKGAGLAVPAERAIPRHP
jgi:DNA-binding SARP family transcriptional activator